MQALDLLHRRLWQDRAAGLDAFLAMAREDLSAHDSAFATSALDCCARLEKAAARLGTMRGDAAGAEAGATAFLELAGLAALGWIAARLTAAEGEGEAARTLRVAGEWFLRDLVARCAALDVQIIANAGCGDLFRRATVESVQEATG